MKNQPVDCETIRQRVTEKAGDYFPGVDGSKLDSECRPFSERSTYPLYLCRFSDPANDGYSRIDAKASDTAVTVSGRTYVNETGAFVLVGPHADAGLTGRKIIVDTYGGVGSHGGGAFSGKDPSKVDRSASYAARYVAKNIVGAKLADKCEVQLAYAIGVPDPVSINVLTYDTSRIPEDDIEALVRKHFNLRPASIIKHLDLLRPIYRKTAAYGHFGRREPGFTWEKTDKVKALKKDAGI